MIINGDCLDEMKKMEDNSISAIVTDPPYGISFMGKGWDHEVPGIEYWKECLRITKPGGHILAMGGTRTYHRLACAIEDAGYEIRDSLLWIYASGFPKSHNHFGIDGFGSALKPAHEPIIMAMKPLDGTFKQNAEKWGQAGINIDGCRIGTDVVGWGGNGSDGFLGDRPAHHKALKSNEDGGRPVKGRWPANVIFDEEAAKMLDEQQEAVSRFFYCAKTSSRERNEGLDGLPDVPGGSNVKGYTLDVANGNDRNKPTKNHHPTVKPLKLMRYLITLIMPPKDGILLDPFAGSGSTIIAAHQLGVKAIGIEKQAEYVQIARKRLEYYKQFKDEIEPDLFDKVI